MSPVILFPAVTGRRPDPGPDPARRLSLHEAVAQPRRRHRGLVTAAGRWALARGLPLPADHVALWAAAAEYGAAPGAVDGVTGPWLAAELPAFVAAVRAWCAPAGCQPPADLVASLRLVFAFLADSGRLHPASDPLLALDRALSAEGCAPGLRLQPTTSPGPRAA